ncbi:helix-turn-helix transcriptional regulator [Streptomyces sp. NBC_01092]|uniref:helix-turn-helix transcriptional regulator n=1 Tax=Streptomyces sp. NBC_01092 TaxID=2903748 RepID=UPI00386C79C2|nr:helix-turn-helix domain-containing protein [Streptomyces sp. NBC_01092]
MGDPATLDEVRRWPALVSLAQAARALGFSTATAYRLHRRDGFPVPVVKVGSRRRVRTADLVRLLEAGGGTA